MNSTVRNSKDDLFWLVRWGATRTSAEINSPRGAARNERMRGGERREEEEEEGEERGEREASGQGNSRREVRIKAFPRNEDEIFKT